MPELSKATGVIFYPDEVGDALRRRFGLKVVIRQKGLNLPRFPAFANLPREASLDTVAEHAFCLGERATVPVVRSSCA
jgi:hypothetical protein